MVPAGELERALRGAELAGFLAHTRGVVDDPAGHALARLAVGAQVGDSRHLLQARARRLLAAPRLVGTSLLEAGWQRELATGDAATREAAWRARHGAVAAAAPDLQAFARAAGEQGLHALALAGEVLDHARLASAQASLDAATRPALRGGEPPWDLDVWPPELWRDVARSLAAHTPPPSHEPLGGGAATYAISPPDDVRVVAAAPGPDWRAWYVLLHEHGHAAVRRALPHGAPPLGAYPAAPWLDEAVAQCWAWQLAELAPEATARLERERLLVGRLRLAHADFERGFLDGAADLDQLWRDVMRRWVGVDVPRGAFAWVRQAHASARRPGSAATMLVAEAAAWEARTLVPQHLARAVGRAGGLADPDQVWRDCLATARV